jgi:hypothetical protein
MKLDHPFLQLPLAFDSGRLAREVAALDPAAWRPHPQGYAGNDALPLVSVNGDPGSDAVRGPLRPTQHLLDCPYLMQVMHSIGAVWGRSRLMRLQGQADVSPHVDINYYWREHTRVHVPIVTQPTVMFHCGDAVVNMAEGECWTFDTWRLHRVHNDDDRARIHLVADTVGGHGFWELMRQARTHDAPRNGWQPRWVAPARGPVALDYESFNLPTVMSPWEARTHLEFLAGEIALPGTASDFLATFATPFLREWHALWAKYGDGGAGLAEYRAQRDLLRGRIGQFESVRLRNNLALPMAVNAIVTSNLVASDAGAAQSEMRVQPAATRAVPSPAARPAPAPAVAIARHRASAPTWGMPMATAGAVRLVAAPAPTSFERPVILLSAPRSGSTLLFETLSQAPGLVSIGHESHRTIEGLPGLHPAARGFASNRLTASDATPEIVEALRRNFALSLRDRDGHAPAAGAVVRLLEKTPKNSLRVPFLRRVFPDAHFVYLYRDPRDVLGSMIDAWQSGRFVTYPNLADWTGLPWSLLLIPGWRDLAGRPIEEIVARQWTVTTDILLDDLSAIEPAQWTAIRYADLIAQPQQEVQRLARRAGFAWDRLLDALPLSRHTLTPPEPGKWRRYEVAITRVLPTIEAARARAEHMLSDAMDAERAA